MSKLLAATIATAGAATASVGGAYLIKQQGNGDQQTIQNSDTAGANSQGAVGTTQGGDTPPVAPTPETSITFESLEAFKEGGKTKSKCVKDFFDGGISDTDKADSATVLQGTDVPTQETFFKSGNDSQTPYKSCLIVDWKKDKYQNNKWKGVFTGTGTFVKGDEGFVNFNIAETSSKDSGKLEFKGVFYLLGKGSSTGDKWEVKYKKDSKDDIKADSSELDQYFPKKGTGVATNKGDYGGFLQSSDSGEKLKDMCDTSDCTDKSSTDNPEKEELSWEGSKGSDAGDHKLKDGAQDLEGGSKIYENSSWNLKEKIENFSGTGSTAQKQ